MADLHDEMTTTLCNTLAMALGAAITLQTMRTLQGEAELNEVMSHITLALQMAMRLNHPF